MTLAFLHTWEFPKIGDPNLVPEIVGSLVYGPLNRVPLIFGNSHIGFGLVENTSLALPYSGVVAAHHSR